jgi:hypothetical protein
MKRALILSMVVIVACFADSVAGATTWATKAPFSDPNAQGYIGLCNSSGQQVTSGSTTTVPVAYRAVSSFAAPVPYSNAFRTAILLAYSPQQYLDPGQWSGEELTASSRYTNVKHPMVAATGDDESLATYVADYPPHWQGFVELRIYLGTADTQAYSVHYPTLAIQVKGDQWHAVGGGPVNCHSGTAESLETILLGTTTTTSAQNVTTTTSPSTSFTGTTASASGSTSASSGGSSVAWWILGVAVVVGGGGFLLGRRSRTATPRTSKKG